MTDQQIELVVKVAGLCAIGAFWPILAVWLEKRGIVFRSMKEQREYEKKK